MIGSRHLWQPTGEGNIERFGTALPVLAVAELEAEDRDPEVGPMYCIVLPDGSTFNAFQDELDPEPESYTLHMVFNQNGDGFWEEN